MSVIFLFGKSTCSRLPQAVQLSRRAGQEVPSYLEEGAAAARGVCTKQADLYLTPFPVVPEMLPSGQTVAVDS